jgi:uncharacterized glyoxalase superfamily protein PhnB
MSIIPPRIDAVTLAVTNLQRSTEFYKETLGFTQVADSEAVKGFDTGGVRLDLIDESILLDEMHLDSFPRPPGPITLVIQATREQVDEYVAFWRSAGARVIAPAEDKALGPRIGYVADPDGHAWEIGAFD